MPWRSSSSRQAFFAAGLAAACARLAPAFFAAEGFAAAFFAPAGFALVFFAAAFFAAAGFALVFFAAAFFARAGFALASVAAAFLARIVPFFAFGGSVAVASIALRSHARRISRSRITVAGSTTMSLLAPRPIGSNGSPPIASTSAWSSGESRTMTDSAQSPPNMWPFTVPATPPNISLASTRGSSGSTA
jgi:hypothetical protein